MIKAFKCKLRFHDRLYLGQQKIPNILCGDAWNTEGTTDCLSNIEITINEETYKYHSDCGTFNDNVNQNYLSLDDERKAVVNAIFSEYISLTTTEVPAE